jgi:AcrR family transcriptional regulator
MPRTAEQNEKIRQATRAAIVDSAMALFAQNGYAHTTTRQIARQAGISTGLMYHYFDSKEELLQDVFDNCMTILGKAFADALVQGQPGRRLTYLLRTMFDLLEKDKEFWSLFYMLRSQPSIMTILGDAFRLWTARLRALFVAELEAAGRADPELDALIIYSLIEGTIQQYLLDPDNYPLNAVSRRIIDQV